MWKVAIVIALAVGQVPAAPQEYYPVDYTENVQFSQGSRILSGWDAQPGQFPHHASLRMINALGGASGCGGSVISREWVVSAAHCTASQVTVIVRAGVVDINNPEYVGETQEFFNHPTFNANTPLVVQPNDISLIKLQQPVTYTNLLRAIRVQPRLEANRNYDGLITSASGHGRVWTDGPTSQVLQWVYLRATSNVACQRLYGNLITANSICAGFYNVTSQSTCHGDSGGPLVHVSDDGVPTLIATASFVAGGEWGCHSGLPAGFTRIGPFLGWFTQISGLDFENLDEEEVTEAPTEPPTTTTTTEEPTTTTTTEEPTTTTTEAPTTTPEPEPQPEESEEESDSSESEEDETDPELAELLKKLEVLVKVKVKMSKNGIKHVHHHNKTISRHH